MPPTADRVIDLHGRLLLPGLVNTHHHLYQTLTRAVPGGQDALLFGWLKTLYPIWARFGPEEMRVSALTGLAELALSGCTLTSDHLYLYPNGARLDDTIGAAAEIGLRFHPTRGAMSIGESKGGLPPDALVESALKNVRLVESMDFSDIVISIKSSDVLLTIDSYIKASKAANFPLHLGITEAGTLLAGSVKSSVGLGILLYNGIGDTIRVSLTGDPAEEIYAAKEILKSLKLLKEGIEIISCPTCGRTCVDLIRITEEVEKRIKGIEAKKPLKVAIMGCAVNGPGEAKEADLGIAGGQGEFLLFLKGKTVRKIPQENVIEELIKEIEALQSV